MVPALHPLVEGSADAISWAEQGDRRQITFMISHSASEMRGVSINRCKRTSVNSCKLKIFPVGDDESSNHCRAIRSVILHNAAPSRFPKRRHSATCS